MSEDLDNIFLETLQEFGNAVLMSLFIIVLIYSVFLLQNCHQGSDPKSCQGQLKMCVMCAADFHQNENIDHENNTRFSIPGKFLTNWDLGMICSIEKPFSCNPRLCRFRPGFVDSNLKLNNINIIITLNIEFGKYDISTSSQTSKLR